MIICLLNSKEFQKTCDIIHSHSEKIIRDRRQLMKQEKPGSRPMDFLDILLSGRVRMSVITKKSFELWLKK